MTIGLGTCPASPSFLPEGGGGAGSLNNQAPGDRRADDDHERAHADPEQCGCDGGQDQVQRFFPDVPPEGERRVRHDGDDHHLKALEQGNHQGELPGTGIKYGQCQHQEERRQSEPDIRRDRAPHPSHPQPDIGRHLHRRRPRHRLADHDAILEGFLGQPFVAFYRQFLDVCNHGRPAERGDPEAQEGTEDRGGARTRRGFGRRETLGDFLFAHLCKLPERFDGSSPDQNIGVGTRPQPVSGGRSRTSRRTRLWMSTSATKTGLRRTLMPKRSARFARPLGVST